MTSINFPDLANLPAQYDHEGAQRRWGPFWERQRYFHAQADDPRTPFTIVIPPPNVTGALHLGHALNNTLQDILVRMKRMQNYNVLWMPGTDHAGIATQAVVERRLLEEERMSRHDLGRDGLVDRIWKWKEQYEVRILGQLKQLGASCDWERLRFTLDPVCARAVRETFFRLFRDQKIFRGKRLVNWDTFLQTAVSDDEVFHEAVKGAFWHFHYPVVEPRPGEPTHVTIATTRPETMLGDTAVAVHPAPRTQLDQSISELRSKIAATSAKERPALEGELKLLEKRRIELLPKLEQLCAMAREGRLLELPLTGRKIPLIADPWAKPELGSGCVKITPAHDDNDYQVWQRHPAIGAISIMNPDGTLGDGAPEKYRGLTMKQARLAVVADLVALGCHDPERDVEDREIDLAHSDRSKTPIEPYLADQWFVRMEELSQTAMDAVVDGRITITPARYAKGYLDWLGEKRDWPIGRQLWWGHRIPIWYAPGATEAALQRAFAGRDDVVWQRDEALDQWLVCTRADDLPVDAVAGCTLRRDEEVLDTWFSSALWPHSTLGWPDETPELQRFYPTSVLVTSRDILTLWVARMVLTGLYNLGEIPFRDVYIHPKILDGYGETMSKSKGNGVDPLDVIEKFGADALRFGVAYLTTETQDVRLPVEFECPHCQALIAQTKKNRTLPRIECEKCGKPFGTQWSASHGTAEDQSLVRAAVVSERFDLGRRFCNKLWNAARFSLMNLQGYTPGTLGEADLTLEDRWLLSRLSSVAGEVTDSLDQFRYADAARTIYAFAWNDFCDYYVEISKSRLESPQGKTSAQRVLAYALDVLLRLLHPMVPFLTEEVWQLLARVAPQRGIDHVSQPAESICVAPWPEPDKRRIDSRIEAQFAQFQAVLGAVREIRMAQNISPKEAIQFAVRCDAPTAELLTPMSDYFRQMARATLTEIGPEAALPEQSAGKSLPGVDVGVDVSAFFDAAAEMVRLEKQRDQLAGHLASLESKLANESFVSRAPADVVAAQRARRVEVQEQLASINSQLAKLST